MLLFYVHPYFNGIIIRGQFSRNEASVLHVFLVARE
jgi:hypothetical protein